MGTALIYGIPSYQLTELDETRNPLGRRVLQVLRARQLLFQLRGLAELGLVHFLREEAALHPRGPWVEGHLGRSQIAVV